MISQSNKYFKLDLLIINNQYQYLFELSESKVRYQ
jgi:hypothetical protein